MFLMKYIVVLFLSQLININDCVDICLLVGLPCQLDMDDDGVVLASQLAITTAVTPDLTTYTLSSPVETYDIPVWEEVTLAPGNAKTVTVTPVDEHGMPTGPAKTITVTDPTAPIQVYFDTPVTADHLLVEVTPEDPTLPVPVVESVLSCMPEGGRV